MCQTTRWVGAISPIYDFNSFDKVIHQIHDQGDIEIRLEETPFGEIEKSILLGGRIYKTSNEKLAIDKLRHGVMFVKSPKGSGKTQNLPQLMEPLISAAIKGSLPLAAFEEIDEEGVHNLKLSGETNYSILLIGHRRSLIREMSQRLGLACYLDDDPKDEGDRINADQRLYDRQKRYGICLDSLAKLKRETYSLIIIDESEQVLSHFLSDTMKDKRDKIFSQLAKLLRKSDTIICLDADLSWVTFNTICDLAPAKSKDLSSEKREKGKRYVRGDEDSKPVFIYLNDYVIKNKTIDLYKSKSHLTEDLLQSLAENKKIFVASNSKKQVKQLYEVIEKKLKDKKILQITSENSSHKEIQNFIKNIKEEFIHYDAVLTSPSLSTGVDITFPNEAEEVDVVYGFFENNITHHFEIDQQISRVRHPKAIKIWISPQTLNYETDISVIRSHELAAIAYANTRSEVNLTDSYEATSTNEKLIRLACLVSSRERASMNHLRANFVRYKQTQGFDFNVIEVDEELSELGGKALNAANLVLTEHRIESLMTAKNIDHGTFIRISESKDSTFEVSEALSNAYWKSVIELFFRQDITKELIKKTEGNWMRKIKALEGLMSLHRDSDERTNTYSLLTLLKDTLIVNAATYRSVRNEITAQLLLALILNKTPIYKDGYFIFDREFCNDDLKEFASFVFAVSRRRIGANCDEGRASYRFKQPIV